MASSGALSTLNPAAVATVPYGAFGEETQVMSDELLQRLVAAQAAEAVKAYGPQSGAEDKDVLYLRVDFQAIMKIDNLYTFVGLRKLQLDNNQIEKIENLDSLVNLEWLDLSFNRISKIEGLSALTRLTDLSLAYNRIAALEGLDALTRLDVLSVAGNMLGELETPVLYLRRFRGLRSLSIAGNPLCGDERYEAFVAAMLPVKYLDFRRVAEEAREAAVVRFQDRLELIMAKEAEESEQRELQQHGAEEDRIYTDACVKDLNGGERPRFLVAMVDPELDKLKPIPLLPDILSTFLAAAGAKAAALASVGLEQRARRKAEERELREAIEAGRLEVREKSSALVTTFLEDKAAAQVEARERGGVVASGKAAALRQALQGVKEQLLELEIELVSNTEDALRRFERSYADLVSAFTEQVQNLFGEIREAETGLHKDMTDVASAFIERFLKGEVENAMELPDSLLGLLNDKATLTNVINSAHDNHLMAIDSKEDEIVSAVNKEIESLVTGLQNAEMKRNRARVAEICNFVSFQLEDISHMEDD